jgi:hypothetical protein
MDTSAMTTSSSADTLDPFSQGKVDFWHAASLELSIGPEADDPFVQVAVHAVLGMAQKRSHTESTPGVVQSSTRLARPTAAVRG